MVSKKDLWEAQLREWPESIRVTVPEMIEWIDSKRSSKHVRFYGEHVLWRSMAMCMQHSNGVFYRTSSRPDAHVGFRFGLHGSQYISGWPLWDGEYGC
jgi:hypothetical protein